MMMVSGLRGPKPPTMRISALKSKSDRRMGKSKHRVEADSIGRIRVPDDSFGTPRSNVFPS